LICISFFLVSCGSSTNPDNVFDKKKSDTEKINSSTLKVPHKKFDLEGLKKNRASIFIFLSPDCPLCQGYAPAIRSLDSIYSKDSIKTYAIFPGQLYSDESIKKFFSEFKLNIPYFIDDDFVLCEFMKATITPEAFIVNKEGEVIYGGRIDNWAYELGKKRTTITQHDLSDALQNFISGKEIKNKNTEAVGCIIEKAK